MLNEDNSYTSSSNLCGISVVWQWSPSGPLFGVFWYLELWKNSIFFELTKNQNSKVFNCPTPELFHESNFVAIHQNEKYCFEGNRMLKFTIFLSLLTGLDYIKHGEVAYPNKAQGDGWYNRRPRYSMDLTSSPRPSFDLTAKHPINAISEEDEGK